jgi:hypothetical protein
MRFIHDQEIPFDLLSRGEVRRLFGRVQGGNDGRIGRPEVRAGAKRRVVCRDGSNSEFLLELLLPLIDERRKRADSSGPLKLRMRVPMLIFDWTFFRRSRTLASWFYPNLGPKAMSWHG